MPFYRRGDHGPAVAQIRAALVSLGYLPSPSTGGDPLDPLDGLFDADVDRAVRAFQQHRGLVVDGIVDEETFRTLDEARWRLGDRVLSYTVAHPFSGDDVVALQERLLDLGFDPGRCDGVFGAGTERALRAFQRDYGLVADGTCGPATMRALLQLSRAVRGGRPTALREGEQLYRAGPTLVGKKVVIDPGHGGLDRGVVAPDDALGPLDEATVSWQLAGLLEGRLLASGLEAYLTRGPDQGPDDAARAAFANSTGADLLVSLHTDGTSSGQAAQGVATFFYGSWNVSTHSASGERLAGLVQREILARTDLVDCRTHAKTWELLRRTRMPAVRIDLGYLTNPGDRARLRSHEFLDHVAEAVLVALQRLYLPADLDPPTGTLRLPALSAT